MKQIKLNTEILPLLQLDMYGSSIDPNEFSQNFYDSLDDEDPRTSETEHFDFAQPWICAVSSSAFHCLISSLVFNAATPL